MNADQAREMTLKSKFKLPQVIEGIQAMAKAGHSWASFEPQKIHDPEQMKKHLESEGFAVSISPTAFRIEW